MRKIAVNLGLILLGFIVAFSLLELSLSFSLIPGGYKDTLSCNDIEDRGRFHPVFGWTEIPENKYLMKGDKTAPYDLRSYNSKGFRDTYNSGNRDNIIVLGDSFTEGSLAGDSETFPFLLDRWTPTTSFHNFGMRGYGTGQELLAYRDVATNRNHSLVILAYYLGNDAKDNIDRKPERPIFAVKNGSLVQTHHPIESNSTASGLITNPTLERVQEFLNENLYTYRFLRRKIHVLLNSKQNKPPKPPEGVKLNTQLNTTKALIEELSTEAKKNASDVLLVVIPERGEINPDNPAHYPHKTGKAYWNAQRDMILSAAENTSNLQILDLKPLLKEEFEEGNQLYGEGVNSHLEDYGYRVTAKVIYNRLIEEGYIGNSTANLSKEYGRDLSNCPNF